MSTFWAVVRNEWTLIFRDRWYLLLMTVGAMGTLITLAYTLSADIEDVATLVVNLDDGPHGRQLVHALSSDPFFDLRPVARREEAERRLRAGSAKIVVVIPAGFSYHVNRGEPVQVQTLIDGSEPGVADLARTHVVALVGRASYRLAVEETDRRGGMSPSGMGLRLRIRYNGGLKTVVSVVPGLMAMVLTVPAVGASAAYARERERGSFELVSSTPVGRWPLLLGRVFPYVVVGLVDIVVFTVIGCLIFDVPLRGRMDLFVLMGTLYIFATASSGVFIAQFLRTQHAATIVTFELFGITPVYLSDIFFPVASMPAWLQVLSAGLPATHFTIIARGIFLKGIGWRVLWPNGVALLATGVVMSLLAYTRFRKKLE